MRTKVFFSTRKGHWKYKAYLNTVSSKRQALFFWIGEWNSIDRTASWIVRNVILKLATKLTKVREKTIWIGNILKLFQSGNMLPYCCRHNDLIILLRCRRHCLKFNWRHFCYSIDCNAIAIELLLLLWWPPLPVLLLLLINSFMLEVFMLSTTIILLTMSFKEKKTMPHT